MTASSVRIWTAIPGALLVVLALYEVFNDLFHPANSGMLSDFAGRRLFRLFRRWPSVLPASGPLALVVVIAIWAGMLACGFALLYWSHPDAIWPAAERSFGACLYFSMEALTTLGLGEIRPVSPLLRTLASLESIVGLALVTASVSWIVLIYPALSRMRCLSRRAFIVHDAELRTGIDIRETGAEPLLEELIVATIRARIDFVHFPLIYYFAAYDKRGALAASLDCLERCACVAAEDPDNKRLRLSGTALTIALDELAELLATRFLKSDVRERSIVFDLYRRDHLLSDEEDF